MGHRAHLVPLVTWDGAFADSVAPMQLCSVPTVAWLGPHLCCLLGHFLLSWSCCVTAR